MNTPLVCYGSETLKCYGGSFSALGVEFVDHDLLVTGGQHIRRQHADDASDAARVVILRGVDDLV